jgi:hypothetical protein
MLLLVGLPVSSKKRGKNSYFSQADRDVRYIKSTDENIVDWQLGIDGKTIKKTSITFQDVEDTEVLILCDHKIGM